MTRGLPGSGKTTWAKQFMATQPKGTWKRISKDDLRAMLDNGVESPENEVFILDARDRLIEAALSRDLNVIVDDTNFVFKQQRRVVEFCLHYNAEFEVKNFDTKLEVCIERDAARPNPVGKEAITNMWKEFVDPSTNTRT